MPELLLGSVEDETTERNFTEVREAFGKLSPIADGALGPYVDLVAGDNPIDLPKAVPNPRGRLTVFLSAAVTLFDVGLASGKWVVNASAPARARFLFF